jgi:hypothetical protein
VGVVQAPVGNRFREDENEPLWLGTGELPQWEPL